jgi:hypothetical protein
MQGRSTDFMSSFVLEKSMLRQKRVSSDSAAIETLESRRLMSASPVTHALPALVETHAVKVHKPIPSIAGTTYTGTFHALGQAFTISITFNTESSTGAVTATVNAEAVFPSTGTVKNTGAVVLHGRDGKITAAVTAKLSADLNTLKGRGTVHGKKSVSAAFTLTRVV